eukprot:TRINITY_DN428_c0_g1_i1.p1 TRINITY_DN428_c0_g1~~TRINITY_DN428_c0_g1_i1.p1  ORF type:complete len:226 (-),score=73.83 TRINITY_DN428_c0_g1_i1:103-759(-)
MANIAKIDDLHEKKEYEAEKVEVDAALSSSPNDANVLWRASRLYFELSELSSDKPSKQASVEKGLQYAKKAVEADDKNGDAHKWFAIMTSTIGDYVSTKEKIGSAASIKEHAVRSLELKPNDPSTLHLLGRWCYAISSIGWVERKLASAPTSSYEEALEYFLKADGVTPTIRNSIYIGESYTQLKQTAKAKEWYSKAASLPVSGPVEQKLHDDAVAKC